MYKKDNYVTVLRPSKIANEPGPVARSGARLPGMLMVMEIGHKNISMSILPQMLIQVGQLSETGERMCT